MVVLNDRKFLQYKTYWGAKAILGSSGSAVVIDNDEFTTKVLNKDEDLGTTNPKQQTGGMIRRRLPHFGLLARKLGNGLYFYGNAPSGSGITPYGGGITPYGGMIMRSKNGGSLFSSAKKALSGVKDVAKSTLKNTVAPLAKDYLGSQVKKINNPIARSLAQTGLDTGSKMLDNAIEGNRRLSDYGDILKEGATEAVNKNKGKVMNLATRELGKRVGKLGLGYEDDDTNVNFASLRNGYRPIRNDGRKTEGNNQLQLLKNIIKSKPL